MDRREWLAVLAEAHPDRLRAWAAAVERTVSVRVTQPPRAGLVMLAAQDAVEGIPFYLGEALVTTAEVQVGEARGYAMVLGLEEERALLAATLDAALQGERPSTPGILADLAREREVLREGRRAEREAVEATRVEFSTLNRQG